MFPKYFGALLFLRSFFSKIVSFSRSFFRYFLDPRSLILVNKFLGFITINRNGLNMALAFLSEIKVPSVIHGFLSNFFLVSEYIFLKKHVFQLFLKSL